MGGVWCCGSDPAFLVESAVLSFMVEVLGEICQAVGAVISPACFLSALQRILGSPGLFELWWWWDIGRCECNRRLQVGLERR